MSKVIGILLMLPLIFFCLFLYIILTIWKVIISIIISLHFLNRKKITLHFNLNLRFPIIFKISVFLIMLTVSYVATNMVQRIYPPPQNNNNKKQVIKNVETILSSIQLRLLGDCAIDSFQWVTWRVQNFFPGPLSPDLCLHGSIKKY